MPFTKLTLIPSILATCPEFSVVWQAHCEDWAAHGEGAQPGDFSNASIIVGEIVRLYESGKTDCFPRFFDLLEQIIVEGDENARGIAVVGYLEDLQTAGAWKEYGADVFLQWMGPESKKHWQQIYQWWAGGKSLMDIAVGEAIRERNSKKQAS